MPGTDRSDTSRAMSPAPRYRRPAIGWISVVWFASACLQALLATAASPDLGSESSGPAARESELQAAAAVDPRISRREAQAQSALATGKTAEALGHWAMILCLDRSHRVQSRLRTEAPAAPPIDSPALDAAQKALARRFRVVRTAHFAIVTDADAAEVRRVERVLEDTLRAFTGFTARLELEVFPIRHRLVCIVFDRHRDFARFGREHDGVHATWCHGYYNPRHDRAVLYVNGPNDIESDDSYAARRRTVAAVHETIHQLSYHCLVQNLAVQYPLWLSEGLATSFETDDTSRRFGPTESFEARDRRLVDVTGRADLEPLESFVVRTRVGSTDPDVIESAYSQSYALFSWLISTRPAGVRALLEALQREPPGQVIPDRQRELFEAAFGTIGSLQRSWELHIGDRVRRMSARRVYPANVAADHAQVPALSSPQVFAKPSLLNPMSPSRRPLAPPRPRVGGAPTNHRTMINDFATPARGSDAALATPPDGLPRASLDHSTFPIHERYVHACGSLPASPRCHSGHTLADRTRSALDDRRVRSSLDHGRRDRSAA